MSTFDTLIAQHELYAKRRPGGARILMRFEDLQGVSAQRRDLREAHFVGCNLSSARFALSDLSEATFYTSVLMAADLRGAKLVKADLRGSALWGAQLYAANLDGADMREAELVMSSKQNPFERFRHAFETSQPTGARTVSFASCSMKKARFSGAKLDGADFSGADLTGACFKGASLRGANFQGALVVDADFASARTAGAVFEGAVGEPDAEAWAARAGLALRLTEGERFARSSGSQGRPCDVSGADLRVLEGGLSKRVLAGARFSGVQAAGVDFSEAVLVGARFDGADLRGADLSGADLRGVNFKGARLDHANLDRAVLRSLRQRAGGAFPPIFEGATGCFTCTGRPEFDSDTVQALFFEPPAAFGGAPAPTSQPLAS